MVQIWWKSTVFFLGTIHPTTPPVDFPERREQEQPNLQPTDYYTNSKTTPDEIVPKICRKKGALSKFRLKTVPPAFTHIEPYVSRQGRK
jgi:hypothetical protein